MCFCLAFLYRATGDEKYAKMAWQAIEKTGTTPRVHDGGIMFRNTHFALFLLSDAAKDWSPVPGVKLPLDGYGPEGQKSVDVPAVSAAPEIDGGADEAAWKDALRLGPFVTAGGGKASPEASAFVTYDKDNLYIAIVASEPSTDKLKMDVKERDGKVYTDDSFEIYLDPANRKEREFIALFVNPANTLYDRNREQAGAWNGEWKTAVKIDQGKSWTVEVSAPWKTLGVTPSSGHKLGLMICRNRLAGGKSGQRTFSTDCVGSPKETATYPVLLLK
jgi:hypothetical protein